MSRMERLISYQTFVVFAAVNGTFDENDSTQAERVITF